MHAFMVGDHVFDDARGGKQTPEPVIMKHLREHIEDSTIQRRSMPKQQSQSYPLLTVQQIDFMKSWY